MQFAGLHVRILAGGLLAAAALAVGPGTISAQDAKKDEPAKIVETEEEKLERDGRRKCAAAICSTLHNKKPAEGLVSCSLRKTWRKEILSNILSKAKVSWPWGDTRCASDISVDRAVLVKAMAGPEFEADFETYSARCTIDNDKSKYEITAQFRPKVTFKDGKAIKASLNWGKIEAPTLANGVLWPLTAADNKVGLLQSTVVEDINEFITTRCMEVKDSWQDK
jgi:hypothetical protein